MIKFDTSDLTSNLAEDMAQLLAAVNAETDRTADKVLEVAVEATPMRTGRLRAGWQKERVSPQAVEVFNDVPYAGYVDQGTSKMAGAHMTDTAVDAATRVE